MATVGTRGREFTQLVTNHVLVDEYRDVLASVVDSNGQTNHVGQYHRSP